VAIFLIRIANDDGDCNTIMLLPRWEKTSPFNKMRTTSRSPVT
jgi:hypothetical protein